MINILILLISLILLSNCSFDTKSGFWTNEKKLSEINYSENILFEKKKEIDDEFNPELKIIISDENKNKDKNKFNTNDDGIENVLGNLSKISKYKFSKISNFNLFEPEILFEEKNLIFFDKKGSIIKFNSNSEILWKQNFYNKLEKKNGPFLKINNAGNNLLITDNFSKIYLIDSSNGNLIWRKEHSTSFTSQIKIDDDKFYFLDTNNNFLCFSVVDGTLLWQFQSEESLFNPTKQTSVVISENLVIYNNTKGEIVALDKNNGNLVWIFSTISYEEVINSFLLNNSDLVLNKENIYFSNNKGNFFSIGLKTGLPNWSQKINSQLRPVVIDNIIITISTKGYLYILEKKNGNIIRINDILYNYNPRKRKKIQIMGFAVTKEKIYVSTSRGQLIVVNIINGKQEKIINLGRNKISKPYVNLNELYVIKDNEIIKLN